MIDDNLEAIALQAQLNAQRAAEPKDEVPREVALEASANADQATLLALIKQAEQRVVSGEVPEALVVDTMPAVFSAPPQTKSEAEPEPKTPAKLTLLSLEKRVRQCESAIDMLIDENARLKRDLHKLEQKPKRVHGIIQGGGILDQSGGRGGRF